MKDNTLSEDILTLIKEARKSINNILSIEDEEVRVKRALVFVLMLQSIEQLMQELTFTDKAGQEEGMRLLDEAILKLSEGSDDMESPDGAWYDPNNKGNA
jgi:hypothetical protein